MISKKNEYELITNEALEADSMPDSKCIGEDDKYKYFICGSRKVKIIKGIKMYRILYAYGSAYTYCYIKAESEYEAKFKFYEKKGDKPIRSIEECLE